MLKRINFTALFLSILYLFSFFSFAFDEDELSAKGSVVYYPLTKTVLFSKNMNSKMSMASTTKIMTAVIAIEKGNLTKKINITKDMVNVEGSSSGLQAGDCVSLNDLLYCLMLPSGNEAANIIAQAVAGSLNSFAFFMNKKAKELGMVSSSFVTPSGLDNDNHYTTAYDMALLTSYAITLPLFCKICSTISYKVKITDGRTLYLTNHNKLLNSIDGCFGVKTGFTKKSGRCLVSATKRDNSTVIVVTLNAYNDWEDHEKLIEYGFSCLMKISLSDNVNKIEIPVISSDMIKCKLNQEYCYVPIDYAQNLKIKIYIEKFLYKIEPYKIIGYLEVYFENTNVKIPIYWDK